MAPTLSSSTAATVLIIDDSPKDLEFWSNHLAEVSPQYSILKAQTVKAGLDVCQDQKIDCVVLDLDMDDSSGFEILLNLIPDRTRPEIAVVVLTRLKNPSLHESVVYHGAQACLVKHTTSPGELHEAIQKAVASIAPRA